MGLKFRQYTILWRRVTCCERRDVKTLRLEVFPPAVLLVAPGYLKHQYLDPPVV